MSIEKTAKLDDNGRPINPYTNEPEAEDVHTKPPTDEMDWQGLNAAQNKSRTERGVDIERTARPDKRDREKVERLAAPDWRSEQPLPSAKNSVDPRGKNTPGDFYETDPRQHEWE